jgi:hypothetical protein
MAGIGESRTTSVRSSRNGAPLANGQTEGQIDKLKLVKRQMYGRTKLDLLQARLIGMTCRPRTCLIRHVVNVGMI